MGVGPPTNEAEDEGEHPEPEVQREGKEEEEERVDSDCAEEIFARMAQCPYIPIGMESIGFHLAIRGQQRQQEGKASAYSHIVTQKNDRAQAAVH
jgi:hypothetical protein